MFVYQAAGAEEAAAEEAAAEEGSYIENVLEEFKFARGRSTEEGGLVEVGVPEEGVLESCCTEEGSSYLEGVLVEVGVPEEGVLVHGLDVAQLRDVEEEPRHVHRDGPVGLAGGVDARLRLLRHRLKWGGGRGSGGGQEGVRRGSGGGQRGFIGQV
eukprot:864994-Prorocentrum_minimum.AAC.1